MHRMSRIMGFTAVIVGSVVANAVAQKVAIDKSYLGTWKLNVAKSKYENGRAPRESTRVHEDRGSGFVLITQDTVTAQGQKTRSAYLCRADGKEYPEAIPNQEIIQTVAWTAVDPYTVEFTNRKSGTVTATGTRTVTKDGKTMTMITKTPQGQLTSTTVWEKQ